MKITMRVDAIELNARGNIIRLRKTNPHSNDTVIYLCELENPEVKLGDEIDVVIEKK